MQQCRSSRAINCDPAPCTASWGWEDAKAASRLFLVFQMHQFRHCGHCTDASVGKCTRRPGGPRSQAELLHIIGYDEACIEVAILSSPRRRQNDALMDESTGSAIGAATHYQHCQQPAVLITSVSTTCRLADWQQSHTGCKTLVNVQSAHLNGRSLASDSASTSLLCTYMYI